MTRSTTETATQTTALNADAAGIARVGLWILAIGFGGFMLWAGTAPLDQGMTGTGTVVVSGEKKTVQALVAGRIDAILVSEGDLVRPNQPLVLLNKVQAQAQLEAVLNQWYNARASEARLLAERAGAKAIVWPDDLLARARDPRAAAAMTLHGQLFEARRKELDIKRRLLKNELASLEGQVRGLGEVKRHQQSRIVAQEKELDSFNALVKQGFVSHNRIHEAERNLGELAADLAETVTTLGRTEQSIHETGLKEVQLDQSFRGEAEAQLASIGAEVATLSERITSLEFEVASATVLAPAGGQAMDLAVHTVGGFVQAGQRLMDVVPLDAAWRIKARFPTMAADRLKPGLPVAIRFSTLQRVETPVLTGRIDTVSADQVIDEHTKTPYYQAMIKPDASLTAELARVKLDIKPGMDVEVMANTGERTLLNYLLKPLLDRMAGALTEE